MTPVAVFVPTALVLGLVVALLTPPFQVPDEDHHHFRAFEVSEGVLYSRLTPKHSGGDMPRGLHVLRYQSMHGIKFEPTGKMTLDRLRAGFDVPLQAEQRIETDYPNTTIYPPTPYLASAAAIGVVRLAGAPPLAGMYAGRLANLLLAVALTALALRVAPFQRWTLALVALLPMAVALRSSLSVDAVTTAVALLYVAVCARLAFGPLERLERRHVGALLGVGLLLALSKPGYGVLVVLTAWIPVARFGSRRRQLAVLALCALLPLALQAAWGRAAAPLNRPGSVEGVDMARQLEGMRERPVWTAGMLVRSVAASAPQALPEVAGVFGWQDTPLPRPVAWGLLALLVLVAVCDTGGASGAPGVRARLLALAVSLGIVLLIQAALYTTWNPVGAPMAGGVQGRYWLPAVPPLLFALASTRLGARLAPLRMPLVALFVALGSVATVVTLYQRFWAA